tara:strand:+ start:61 stop:429 length:369 start_codon:yes stop_codon:yes gene_type:complete
LNNKESLFIEGIKAFNSRCYYDAHEYWEELWSDYYLEDANFIQGLIQLSVGYFHITNHNINGAVGLLTKSIKKLHPFSPKCRGIDIDHLINHATLSLQNLSEIESTSNFNWSFSPTIRYINE